MYCYSTYIQFSELHKCIIVQLISVTRSLLNDGYILYSVLVIRETPRTNLSIVIIMSWDINYSHILTSVGDKVEWLRWLGASRALSGANI